LGNVIITLIKKKARKALYPKVKGALDRIFALIGIIILAPLWAVLALMIRSDRMGSAIFKQTRVGKDCKIIWVYKFRTMTSTDVAFDINHAVIDNSNNNLTRTGRFLRKTKLDETPQLINILKGEMSFIGPRPLLHNYLEVYERWELKKFNCKPGLSGLSQVNGNGYLTPKERSYYDVIYAQKLSFWRDVEIFFKTFLVIVGGEERFLHKVNSEDLAALAHEISKEYKNT
jgi:lipopolysaccharide/colanic/teichoic acid biosynthesis glycosyltransferase